MFKYSISVAILTFNHAEYIDECLESVHKLDKYFDIEVVIVDDGSSDGTKAKLAQWAKNDIPYNLNFHEHEGVKAINKNTKKLIQLCKNECIISLAGDDLLISEGIYFNFKHHWNKDIAIIYGNGSKILKTKIINKSVMNKRNIQIFSKQDASKALYFIERNPPMLFLQGALIRRSFVINNRVYDHGFLADDWMINYQIFKSIVSSNYKFIFSNENVFYHRIHDMSTSTNLKIHFKRIEEVLSHFNHSAGYKSLCVISFKNILKCIINIKPVESFFFMQKLSKNIYNYLYIRTDEIVKGLSK